MIPDPRQHSAEEILRDGGSIFIRAIRPDDRERLVEHFHRLSARSVYFRFFNAKRPTSTRDGESGRCSWSISSASRARTASPSSMPTC